MKILIIFGTRPEAIKMCPLVLELKEKEWAEVKVCVTGQHERMLYEILEEFQVKPDWDLKVIDQKQSLVEMCSKIQNGVDKVIKEYNPDVVLVHGDTSTTLNASLASFYNKIALGHVEAGLRSHNKYSPFPEEVNRVLTDRISDFCFAPTEINKENLLKEGVDEKNIYVVGNTISDAVDYTLKKTYIFKEKKLSDISKSKKLILFTCHRRENLGKPMEQIFQAMKTIGERDDVEIVYPVHSNPVIKDKANEFFSKSKNIKMTSFLSYSDMINLIEKSVLIVTDSGGIQEEATILNKPILVVREETERVEAENLHAIKVIGRETENIIKEITRQLDDSIKKEKIQTSNLYGKDVSKKIIEILKEQVKVTQN